MADTENGTTSGGGIGKIDRLIAAHEEIVRALKITRDLLYGDTVARRAVRHSSVFEQAAALDAQRRAGAGPGLSDVPPQTKQDQQRERTAQFLGQFSTTTPHRPADARGLQAYLTAGYLKKQDGGYLRTSKPYARKPQTRKTGRPRKVREEQPDPAQRPPIFTSQKEQRRQASAAFLSHFDTAEPRSVPPVDGLSRNGPLPALVRRGYLRKKGGGYVRTPKPFEVSDNGASAPA